VGAGILARPVADMNVRPTGTLDGLSMAEDTIHLPVDTVRSLMVDVFTALGVPPADADVCADVLIASDLRGIESHGVGRLKMYYDRIKVGIQFPVTDFQVVSDRGATAVVDGGHGMGHVVGVRSMQMAIDKAREFGLGSVAVRNSTHYGIAGYYALMAIKDGMAGLTMTNARPSIAPTFGVEPMLGTNPVTFGCPTDEACPFVIDCATSITQRGKIEVLEREGKPTPEGWAIDERGEPHTDTPALLEDFVARTAALLPLGGAGELLGGHKGYGYSAMVEILSAALQNGSHTKDLLGWQDGGRVPYKLGHFFLAIDIGHFIDLDAFKKTTGDICRALRTSKKTPGQARIWTAGEKEHEMERLRRQEGVPINPALQENIRIMQSELGLTGCDLPF
jgi:L-2-hydroxycarboxylate dehydrogenase (NAD+)